MRNRRAVRAESTGWRTLPSKLLQGYAASALLLVLCSCRAEQPWPLWQAYTARFLDGQGRVIDRSAGDRTTSEGQAYAMFFALVDNDRSHFDRLLAWTEANLAAGDLTLHLPAWDWGKTDGGAWRIRDANSASDADLWLAYTLIEAGRLWKEPRFETLGRTVAREIAQQEVVLVPGVGTVVAPGPMGFHLDNGAERGGAGQPVGRWVLNPSYMPPPVLERLAHAVPEGPWRSVEDALPTLVGGPASDGFAMDWVSAVDGQVHPSAPPQEPTSGTREAQPAGSYDAIRVYLWYGMSEPGTRGMGEMKGRLAGMAALLRTAPTPPLEVDAKGTVVRADAPPGFSAAVIPYLTRMEMTREAAVQRDRLMATRDSPSGLYGHSMEYYDQNLALFSTGFTEQRFRFERDGKLRVRWRAAAS